MSKAEEDICPKHGREYELYCESCPKENKARVRLCPKCVTEHAEKHAWKVAHLEDRIKKKLENLDKGVKELDKKKDVITDITKNAEEITKYKNGIKAKIESMVGRGKAFWTKQAKLVVEKHEAITKTYEGIIKASSDCEYQIKLKMDDPRRMKENAKKLMKDKKYVSAKNEIKKSSKESVNLDDSKVKEQMKNYKKLVDEFELFLADLDIGVFDIPKAKKLKEDKERLEMEKAAYEGMCSNSSFHLVKVKELESKLADREAEIKKDNDEIEGMRKDIDGLRNDKAGLQGTTTI
jgi:hypothetical protein